MCAPLPLLSPLLPLCPPAAQYDDSPEALADALDALLEDPEFLDAVADEVRAFVLLQQPGAERAAA